MATQHTQARIDVEVLFQTKKIPDIRQVRTHRFTNDMNICKETLA